MQTDTSIIVYIINATFLKTGMVTAFAQLSGKNPESNILLNKSCNKGNRIYLNSIKYSFKIHSSL